MTLSAGTRLGPYEILSKLGSGGMGDVWKARDLRLDRFVAVKQTARTDAGRVEREARLPDLVAVPGDPVADIRQLHHVSLVTKGGQIVRRD